MAKKVILVGKYDPTTVPDELFVVTAVSAKVKLSFLFAMAVASNFQADAIVFAPDPQVLGYLTQLGEYSLIRKPWPVEVGFMIPTETAEDGVTVKWQKQYFMPLEDYMLHLKSAAFQMWENRTDFSEPEQLQALRDLVAELERFGVSTCVSSDEVVDLAVLLAEIEAKNAAST